MTLTRAVLRPTVEAVLAGLPAAVARAVRTAGEAATAAGGELWLVGGAPRDAAAGLPLRDADLATDLDPGRLAREVARATDGEAGAWPEFGTAAVRLEGGRVDLAALRSERYARPGALPAVTPGATIEADLARRDFSVNTLALGLAGPRHGMLLDPHQGLEDLARGRMRVLHAGSFRDDPTRLWRGARYAARLRLRPEPATARLIEAGTRWLDAVSGTRLWAEWERTAEERRLYASLRRLEGWGVLGATHAALGGPGATAGIGALRHRPGPVAPGVLLALLLAEAPARSATVAAERLAAPREARRALEDARRLLAAPSAEPDALAELERTVEAGRTAARWLDPARQHELQRALGRWQRTRPQLTAEALVRLGVASGPALGEWLRCLRRERYLGNLSSAAAAGRLVRRTLAPASEPRAPREARGPRKDRPR